MNAQPRIFCLSDRFFDWNTGAEVDPGKERQTVVCYFPNSTIAYRFSTWIDKAGERCWESLTLKRKEMPPST